jgi:hypothetical protein
VRSGVYRPAFVSLRVGEKANKDALTFLVINKSEIERMPPQGYLNEIRRGGQKVWSAEYGYRFELHIQRIARSVIK